METVTDDSPDSARSRLQDDLQKLLSHARELLGDKGGTARETTGSVREQVEAQLQRARDEVCRLEGLMTQNGKRAMRATNEAAHAHPYAAMGAAAGVGLLLGLLIARR